MPINTVSIYYRLFVCLTFASCPRSSVILHFALDRGDFASRLRRCSAVSRTNWFGACRDFQIRNLKNCALNACTVHWLLTSSMHHQYASSTMLNDDRNTPGIGCQAMSGNDTIHPVLSRASPCCRCGALLHS